MTVLPMPITRALVPVQTLSRTRLPGVSADVRALPRYFEDTQETPVFHVIDLNGPEGMYGPDGKSIGHSTSEHYVNLYA
jgi:hypothetical protein